MFHTLDNKLIINKESLNKNNFIGYGASADVFYHNFGEEKLAIKIFINSYLNLNKIVGYDFVSIENFYKSLKNIDTKYILMPQYLLYYNNLFKGIACSYKENIKQNEINYLNINDLKNALNNLINDLNYISEKKIVAEDLSYDNLIFNNNDIYICDVGAFEYQNQYTVDQIKFKNYMKIMNTFMEILTINIKGDTSLLINEYYFQKVDFLKYFDKDSQDCTLFGDYIKKKSKKI